MSLVTGNSAGKPAALTEQLDEAKYGGKATQLAVAMRAGLPVPAGVALPVTLVTAVAAGKTQALRELAEVSAVTGFPVAARSSAVGEDSETASFAGQHATRLNVRSLPELTEAVREIFASARSESALSYRRRLGLAGEPHIGVVVQELVLPSCSGVLFTRNPLDGSDAIVIEASWGLGEAVVAGLVTPDRFQLGRDGTVLEQVAGVKDVAVEALPDGGTAEVSVPSDRAQTLCLDQEQLRSLHALALRCEDVFSGTQDLEWAFADRTLYLLQRRALTR
jgi:pyruvate, water dikinase